MASLTSAFRQACVRMYTTSTRPVVHIPEKQRFEIVFADGDNPFLGYEKVGKVYDLTSTVVPVSKRGLGLAEDLATAAFEHVKTVGGQAKLSCSYIRDRFLPKNEQWNDLVKK